MPAKAKQSAYCVKCKASREMKGAETKQTKNGRNMQCGACAKCGCKMCKFVAGK